MVIGDKNIHFVVSNELHHNKTYLRGFRPGQIPTRLQSLIAEGLIFLIYEVEELYYVCGENKDADQLCSHILMAGFLVNIAKFEGKQFDKDY